MYGVWSVGTTSEVASVRRPFSPYSGGGTEPFTVPCSTHTAVSAAMITVKARHVDDVWIIV